MATSRPLAREVFGAHFQNPVLLASGTAGFGRELAGIVDLESLGGLVTKAVSLAPRHGNPAPRVAEFPGGMLNAIGLANPGLDHVVREELPWLATHLKSARVIVNVVGFTEDEYASVIAGLESSPGITAFEINLSCPNTSQGGIEFGADCASLRRVIERCRAQTRVPLVAKLSPALPDIPLMAEIARDAGADGVSVVNTLPGLLLDPNGRPRLGNGNGGVSGPSLLPLGVLATRRIAERLPGFPIIGVGGIRSAADVRQYLHAGASLVAIGTAGMVDPRLPERIVRELEQNG
ncbi:MAG: dihydroorotate dehydrogenase [Gemmatimonadota bacterium]